MDSLIDRVGGFGKYQKLVLCVIGSIASLAALTTYASVFNNANPIMSCNHKNQTNISQEENCTVWTNMTQSNQGESWSNQGESPYVCKFSQENYGKTIVTEWGLICDKIHLTSLAQTIFMVGALCSFISGQLSDRIGRRMVCIIMSAILSASFIICEILQFKVFNFSGDTQYLVYLVTQFFLGLSSFSLYVVSYVLLIEIISPKYNMIVSIININIYVLGEFVLLLVSYYLRNWHHQNWFIAAYSVTILILVLFILPESPRFLVANKRYKEAAKILSKIAKVNARKNTVSEIEIRNEINGGISEKEKIIAEEEQLYKVMSPDEQNSKNSHSVSYYLRHPYSNTIKTLMLAYVFAALSMIYFGVSLGITSISKDFNPYFMYIMSSLAEFIGYSLCIFDKKISRRTIMIVALLSAGVLCCSVAVIPLPDGKEIGWNSVLIIVCATLGKIAASAAFNLIYLYASEYFPTGIRNTMVSYVGCAGRIGSLISPQINLLQHIVWQKLPYIVFGCNAFMSCLAIVLLPDLSKMKKHDI